MFNFRKHWEATKTEFYTQLMEHHKRKLTTMIDKYPELSDGMINAITNGEFYKVLDNFIYVSLTLCVKCPNNALTVEKIIQTFAYRPLSDKSKKLLKKHGIVFKF